MIGASAGGATFTAGEYQGSEQDVGGSFDNAAFDILQIHVL